MCSPLYTKSVSACDETFIALPVADSRETSDEWMSRVLPFAPLLSAAADAERESPHHLLVSGPSTNFVAPCLGTVKVAHRSGSHVWHIDHQGLFLLALFVFSSDRTLNTGESGPRRVRYRSPHACAISTHYCSHTCSLFMLVSSFSAVWQLCQLFL
jgi:hypothetical protein